MRHWVSI
ncbi:hypothetical protein F383_04854 [Gossypium arboreum]|nr:hypothetical protein F383_04854 [Gossypium arboreum]